MAGKYTGVRREDLVLRDRLAADRTVLANERTLLAYVRTALGLLATGAALVHFVDDVWTTGGGWALVALAPVALAVGVWRFLRIRRDLQGL